MGGKEGSPLSVLRSGRFSPPAIPFGLTLSPLPAAAHPPPIVSQARSLGEAALGRPGDAKETQLAFLKGPGPGQVLIVVGVFAAPAVATLALGAGLGAGEVVAGSWAARVATRAAVSLVVGTVASSTLAEVLRSEGGGGGALLGPRFQSSPPSARPLGLHKVGYSGRAPISTVSRCHGH